MLPNEGGDGVELDCGWLETAVATRTDKVFVTTDSASVTVQTDIGRIAQAITLVERVACVFQHVPDVKTITVVLKCLFVCHWLIVELSCLPSMSHSYTVFSCIESSIEGSRSKVLGRVNTAFEIDMRTWVVVMFYKNGRCVSVSA